MNHNNIHFLCKVNTLIVESGSSKSDWILNINNESSQEFSLVGINPISQSKTTILSILDIAKQNIGHLGIDTIFFYGAGCKNTAAIMMEEMLGFTFPSTKVSVYSDLLAAARSSCLGKAGIVAILGTGSHSCLSDGHKIIEEKPALGYLLADEGSGNEYGKRILKAYFYQHFDNELKDAFELEFDFVKNDFLSQIYSSNKVSADLARFFPFLIKHKTNILLQKIIQEGIENFYINRLKDFENKKELPIHIIGSVGKELQEEYTQYLNEKGFNKIYFNHKPIEGLIEYHNNYVKH